MAIDSYVNQILESPIFVFEDIVDKVIGEHLKNSELEMLRHPTDVDNVLFEAIKSILVDLDKEEGFISRFFYRIFGVEVRKNKRRTQLILLGGQLKTQHSKVKSELVRIYQQVEQLSIIIIDLKRLEKSFHEKNIYFQNTKTLNKKSFFLTEIKNKVVLLEASQNALESKHNSVTDIEKVYSLLFTKIPRYYELKEENPLDLLPLINRKSL